MTLKERLHSDLTDGMRARDELRTATLRMALTAITNEEVSGQAARELSDDEVVTVLQREAKKRRESAEAYDGAGRAELADRERAELGVLDGYLPAAMADEDLAAIVTAGCRRGPGERRRGPACHGRRHEAGDPAGDRSRRGRTCCRGGAPPARARLSPTVGPGDHGVAGGRRARCRVGTAWSAAEWAGRC